MREPLLAHQVISLFHSDHILPVNPHSNSQQHMLGSFNDSPLLSQQVAFFQRFEAKDLIGVISFVVNDLLQLLAEILKNSVGLIIKQVAFSVPFLTKVVNAVCIVLNVLLCGLVQILDEHSGSQKSIVGMREIQISQSLSLVLDKVVPAHALGETLHKLLLD